MDATITNGSSSSSITFEAVVAAMEEFRAKCPKPLPRRIFVASDLYALLMKDRHSGGVQAFAALDGVEITESPLLPDGKWMKDTDFRDTNRIDWVQSAPFMRGQLS